MPRLTRKPTPWPADPPLAPPVRALRVTRPFTCEGRYFHVGQVVSLDNELVQAICREHPHYLEPAR